MKLARFNGNRVGVVNDQQLIDISDLLPVPPEFWPPVSMIKLIAQFDELKPRIQQAVKERKGVPLASVRLESPVVWPNKLIAYPANYARHGEEMKVFIAATQGPQAVSSGAANTLGFFLKAPSSISGPADPIVLPELPGKQIHHECEMAIFIGKGGRHIPLAEAKSHIFGYACLVDVTVRGQQERVMRKSYDSFTPIGPYIVTADEVPDPDNLDLELWVSGERRQKANTRDLIVNVPNMISMAASVTTLYPGDIIAIGTPEGVGPLKAGDELTITIHGVGSMTLPVVAGKGGSNMAFEGGKAKSA